MKIKKNFTKKDEMGPFYDYVIQPSDQRNNLIDTINLLLDFNKKLN